MSNERYNGAVLIHDGQHWYLGACRDDAPVLIGLIVDTNTSHEDNPYEQVFAAARTVLTEWGAEHQGLILALHSQRFVTATISTDGLPRRDRHQAMTYRLEERLPIAAEGLMTAFGPQVNSRCLGVAIAKEDVTPLLNALDQAGLHVSAVCPLGLLAAQGVLLEHPSTTHAVVAADEHRLDLVFIRDGSPSSWSLIPDTHQALHSHVCAVLESDSEAQHVVGVGAIQALAIHAPNGNAETHQSGVVIEEHPCTVAAKAAQAILTDQITSWINLLPAKSIWSVPNRFVRPVIAIASLFILLLLALNGLFLLQTTRHHRDATTRQTELHDLFTTAFPGQEVPVEVRTRLESEHRALAGLGGPHSNTEKTESALLLLQRSLLSLTREPRHRILSITIDPQDIQIEGQARSHTDAETLAGMLRDRGAMDVEPPLTRRLDDRTVTFILNAQPNPTPSRQSATLQNTPAATGSKDIPAVRLGAVSP